MKGGRGRKIKTILNFPALGEFFIKLISQDKD